MAVQPLDVLNINIKQITTMRQRKQQKKLFRNKNQKKRLQNFS